jgi:hypothetical protein
MARIKIDGVSLQYDLLGPAGGGAVSLTRTALHWADLPR